MFLIEYGEYLFVDAEKIIKIYLDYDTWFFDTIDGERETIHYGYHDAFFNHLQAINSNISSISEAYLKSKTNEI